MNFGGRSKLAAICRRWKRSTCPYKPKRRTRATIARERGLQPLADLLLSQAKLGSSKQRHADRIRRSQKRMFPTATAALQGALDIVAEQWSEDASTADLDDSSRPLRNGKITSQVKRGKQEEASKFELYIDHQRVGQPHSFSPIAGHAARRGRRRTYGRSATGRIASAVADLSPNSSQPAIRILRRTGRRRSRIAFSAC